MTADLPTGLFAGVDPLRVQRLQRFRAGHPQQVLHHGRHEWTWYDAGEGPDAILLLHGIGHDAEVLFPQIVALSTRWRVIAPNLPPGMRGVTDAVDGAAAVLDAAGVAQVHVYGVSLGGLLAQIFARRHTDRLHDLVLAHTAVPTEPLKVRWINQRRLLRLYPERLLRQVARRSMLQAINHPLLPAEDDDRAFWQAYFNIFYSTHFRKRHLLNRAALMVDFFSNYEFRSSDLQGWGGRVLLLEASRDDVYDEGERGALKSMYTRAYIHELYGSTHLAPLFAVDETISVVRSFLLDGA